MSFASRVLRLPDQFLGRSPFSGTLKVQRLSVGSTAIATIRNHTTPLKILDFVFPEDEGADLKYLDVPGFLPILFIRDPDLMKTILTETAHKGSFDRDTLPTQGIGRICGKDNLLYAQGETWQRHKRAVVRPLGPGAVQTPEVFKDIEAAIIKAVEPQIEELAARVIRSSAKWHRMQLEPDIKAAMLNVLVNVLFGASIPHEELTRRYLPAIERVIAYILVDSVANPCSVPVMRLPALSKRHASLKNDRAVFEELVERVIRCRSEGEGFWPMLTAAGTEEAIRSNVRVFLAGALEATTSYISWTLANLARSPAAQAKAHQEAARQSALTPEARENSPYLHKVMAESLRLNNALYFLPRVALQEATLTTPKGNLTIPAGTHLILATYHYNRCERYWGAQVTGYEAAAFVPERWDDENLASRGLSTKEMLHFGFGHGPRVCVGRQFSEAEAFVCLTLFLRRFEFRAVNPVVEADSGVSTRPRDKVDLELSLRFFGKANEQKC